MGGMPTAPLRKSLTTWLRETPISEKQIGVRITFRGNVINATRFRKRAENEYLARMLLIALLGRNPFSTRPDVVAVSEFVEEGGTITYFRPHDHLPTG